MYQYKIHSQDNSRGKPDGQHCSDQSSKCKGRHPKRTYVFTFVKQQYVRLQGVFYGRVNSGETWESVAKVGPHANIVVQLGDDGKLVFWRGSSYLPYWETDDGRWYVEEMVARQGDRTRLQHDKICQHAHVKIVENSLARPVILW